MKDTARFWMVALCGLWLSACGSSGVPLAPQPLSTLDSGTDAGVACTPSNCAALGKTCGQVPDGCEGALNCGICQGGQTCGAGGIANVCGMGNCTPTTCAAMAKNCGVVSDGCGATLNCGVCGGSQTCGGSGTANVCGVPTCVATTCAAEHKNCGSLADGCGGTLQCGTCTAPQSCGGGGAANVCGGPACVPTTCVAQAKNCGSISDNCGGTLMCGTCSGAMTCGGSGTPNVCGLPSGSTRWFQSGGTLLTYSALASDSLGNLIGVTHDAILAEHDRQGNLVWTRPDPFASTASYSNVAVSPTSGRIAATGRRDPASGGPALEVYDSNGNNPTLVAASSDESNFNQVAWGNSDDLFYAETSSAGSYDVYRSANGFSWAFHADGYPWTPPYFSVGMPVTVDPMDDPIVTGTAYGRVTVQGFTFGTTGQATSAVLQLDNTGRIQWVNSFDGLNPNYFNDVGTSAIGTVVVLSTATGAMTFGHDAVNANNTPVLFTLEKSGARRWARQLNGTFGANVHLGVNPAGKAAVVASSACGGVTVFQYNLAGDLLWQKSFAPVGCTGGGVSALALAVPGGDVVVAGTFSGSVDFGTGVQVAPSSGAPFLLDLVQ